EERPPGDRVASNVDRERSTVDVAREVLDGKTGLDERLLESAAHTRLDGQRAGVDRRVEARLHRLEPRDLLQQPRFVGLENEPLVGTAHEPQLAVAGDDVLDVEANVLRQRVLRELVERV